MHTKFFENPDVGCTFWIFLQIKHGITLSTVCVLLTVSCIKLS